MNAKIYERKLLDLRSRLNCEVGELIEAMQEGLHVPGDLPMSTHPADQATGALDREVAMIATEQALSDAVDVALSRIRDGSYGKCAKCRQPIARERLDAIPYAVNCRRCAEEPTPHHS